jgi:hypothetical protein
MSDPLGKRRKVQPELLFAWNVAVAGGTARYCDTGRVIRQEDSYITI